MLLLTGLLCGFGMSAKAQATGELYAAPGMRVQVQKVVPVQSARFRPRTIAAVKKDLLIPILSRYWHSSDSLVRNYGYAQTMHYIIQNAKCPADAKWSELKGRVYLTALLSPEGKVINYAVAFRAWTLGSKSIDEQLPTHNEHLLIDEAIRVFRSMKFEPQTGPTDTLTISLGYSVP